MKWSDDETQLDKQLAPENAQIDQIYVSRIEQISMSHTRETMSRSAIIEKIKANLKRENTQEGGGGERIEI